MKQAEARERFITEVLPELFRVYDPDDTIAISEEWSNWTDMLCKGGEITSHQYETWDTPNFTQKEITRALLILAREGGGRE